MLHAGQTRDPAPRAALRAPSSLLPRLYSVFMHTSPWLPRQTGAAVTEYRGARMAANLPGEDPTALFPAAALCDWSFRATLALRGPEARKWLNGIVTANVRDLAPGRTASSFLLSPKGHILAQFQVAALAGDGFLLLTTEAQRSPLLAALRRYVFRSQVEIEDHAEHTASLAVCGVAAERALAHAGLAALPARGGFTPPAFTPASGTPYVLHWQLGTIETFEISGDPSFVVPLYASLAAHATPIGAAAYDRRLLLEGIPLMGRDIRDGVLPPETGITSAVGHNKGCYVGQEIVERIRARGQVHRQFRGFRFLATVHPGDPIRAGDKEVGLLTSVTPLTHGPYAGQWAALGYLRREAEESGAALTAGSGVAGQAASPPLDREAGK